MRAFGMSYVESKFLFHLERLVYLMVMAKSGNGDLNPGAGVLGPLVAG